MRTGATWTEQRYLKAAFPTLNDEFGAVVTIASDGNTVVVAAMLEDSASGIGGNQGDESLSDSGTAWVFARPPESSTWSPQAFIKASNPMSGAHFGRSLAMSANGDTLVAGASEENSNATTIDGDQANMLAPKAGASYVFARTGVAWAQEAYLKASNAEADDGFGYGAAITGDGNVVIVGAPGEDGGSGGVGGDGGDNSRLGSGAAYVFARSGITWSQQAYVKALNPAIGDAAGYSVGISSDGALVTVGVLNEDGAEGIDGDPQNKSLSDSGAAFVFSRQTSSLTHYLKADNRDAGDKFGYIGTGSPLVVGAPHEDSASPGIDGDGTNNSATSSGAVYIFGD